MFVTRLQIRHTQCHVPVVVHLELQKGVGKGKGVGKRLVIQFRYQDETLNILRLSRQVFTPCTYGNISVALLSAFCNWSL